MSWLEEEPLETRKKSTVVIRTKIIMGHAFISVADLQSQLYRDAATTQNQTVKNYAIDLAERLGRMMVAG